MAISSKNAKEIRWKYSSGNSNDKYKRISVRYGKGVAGTVIRTGSPMTISSFPHEIPGKPTDYPILLAEQLISCIAVPICFNQTIWGVLLGGNRSIGQFSPEQLAIMNHAVSQIEQILKDTLHEEECKELANDE
ncbi:hypothetical protein WQ54_23265 [Bacillus sp. SA1-12]|uniref:GAF domain-containing protein n=1 Tax=Bacillus sp. SA1-12 TaxID=1455638 RepID=UPI0006274806|nr:GAF domain-containing protein [Bacillus sp. SA1-12]KKI90041.1 hypothetical protein WQ54_23265 [Bacillus sp. SA1-12]